MAVSTEDSLAINRTIALYGHALDERRWDWLDDVFAPDVTVDFSALSIPLLNDIAAVKAMMAGYAVPPLAHHSTNVLIEGEGDEATVLSKGLMVMQTGAINSWVYRDRIRKIDGKWLITHRTGTRASAGFTS